MTLEKEKNGSNSANAEQESTEQQIADLVENSADMTPEQLKAELQRLRANNERLLAESKKNKEKRQQLEQEKLIAEGKKDELINMLQGNLESYKLKEKGLAIAEAIAVEAEKRGCKKWDHLYRLTDGEFDGGEIEFDDETGHVSGVKEFFDYYSQNDDYSYYFQRPAPVKTTNVIPSTGPSISMNYKEDPVGYLIEVKKKNPEKYGQEVLRLQREGFLR